MTHIFTLHPAARRAALAAMLALTGWLAACADERQEDAAVPRQDMPAVATTPSASAVPPAGPASDPSVPAADAVVDPPSGVASDVVVTPQPKPGQNNDHSTPTNDAKK